VELLRELSGAIEPPIVRRGGEVVKRLGDGLMGAFADASSALAAAVEAHERAGTIYLAGYRPLLRTGIHLGRPRRIGGDYLGVDVNIAARVAQAARPGEILLSARTLGALDERDTFATKARSLSAKGVPDELVVYAVEPGAGQSPVGPSR
jgi:adenylate cyclase